MAKDFMNDWLGSNKRQNPNKKSRYVIDYSKYDYQDVQRMLQEMPEFDAHREQLIDSKAGDLAYEVWQDLYLSFWKVEPRHLPDSEIQPAYIVNSVVMEEAEKLPEHRDLRNWTIGDDIGTALACNTIESDIETLYDRLEEETKMAQQLQQMLQQLSESQDEERDLDELMKQWTEDHPDQEMDPELAEKMQQLADQIQQQQGDADQAIKDLKDALNKARPSISQTLKKSMKEAAKDAETMSSMADSWGLDPGELHRLPAKQRMELARRMNNPKFKKIAELFGSIKRLAFAEQRKKIPWAPEEIHDIELGKDIPRLLPSEIAKLSDPTRQILFLKDFTQGNLMQYEMQGYEKIAKGGIVYCHDGSGSMGGDREIWAKAVGLALLHIAKKQNRPFYAIQFGSPGQLRVDDFRDSQNITPEKVIDFAEFFFGGGPLRVDQRVMTPSGWKPIGTIRVGDQVFGPDGKPVDVTHVFPQGVLSDVYRVTFKDGAEVVCDATHLWTVLDRTVNGVSSDKAEWRTVRLSEIIESGIKANHNGYRFSVPLAEPIELPEAEQPLDPYLMGYLLGDGVLGGGRSVSIASAEGDHPWRRVLPVGIEVKNIEKRAEFCPIYALIGKGRGQHGTNPVVDALKDLALLGVRGPDKFIPRNYLHAAVAQRWAILQGLLDSDGTVCHSGRVEFSSSSEKLSNQVMELVQSLGGVATITFTEPRESTWQGHFRVQIMLPGYEAPFRLERKKTAWTPRSNSYLRSIVKVERVYDAECICIKVNRNDGLFLTEGFVVTHNTDFMSPLNMAIGLLNEEYEKEGRTKSDIVFATDGMCGINDEWMRQFKEGQDKIGFAIWGIIIGGARESEPLFTICEGKVASIKSLTSGESVREIFGGI